MLGSGVLCSSGVENNLVKKKVKNILQSDRVCPICESNEKIILSEQLFSNLSDKNLLSSYKIVSCSNCGFSFADDIPEQDVFNSYYKDMSKYEQPDNYSVESQYDIKRFSQIVNYLLANLKNKDSFIVEVGCATGLLLSFLKNEGFTNLLGIDPSPVCVDTANRRYLIPSNAGTIADISSLITMPVDLLILVGVLEHIRDLDSALKELAKVLSPGGKICIVVPDASQYYNGKDAPFQEFSMEHINFFGPVSLTNLMNKYNFTQKSIVQKVFEVNYNTITPVILGIYSKDNTDQTPINFDGETVTNLEKYITICQREERAIHNKIKKIVRSNDPLIIWGTGSQTLRLLASSDLNKANIHAFVDSNPKYQGNSLNSVPVISPDELKNTNETILISTRAYQNEIELQIREKLKLKNNIIKLFK
jgi:SAM-dependent methyltransferase